MWTYWKKTIYVKMLVVTLSSLLGNTFDIIILVQTSNTNSDCIHSENICVVSYEIKIAILNPYLFNPCLSHIKKLTMFKKYILISLHIHHLWKKLKEAIFGHRSTFEHILTSICEPLIIVSRNFYVKLFINIILINIL